MDILLIEDSSVQIDWARQQLVGHNLIVATNAEAGDKLIKRGFDIVIIDLELPEKDGDVPSVNVGLNRFKANLFDLAHKIARFSGLALVSNFEHHISRQSEVNKPLYEAKAALEMPSYLTARVVTRTLDYKKEIVDDSLLAIKKDDNRVNNIVILCDSINLRDYPFYYLDGKIYSNKEVVDNFNGPLCFCRDNKGMPLKPYREVVEYLSQFVR